MFVRDREVISRDQLHEEYVDFIEGYADWYGVPEDEVPSFDAWLENELNAELEEV
jgi:hypothetical protein